MLALYNFLASNSNCPASLALNEKRCFSGCDIIIIVKKIIVVVDAIPS